jgi:hypothetical protein
MHSMVAIKINCNGKGALHLENKLIQKPYIFEISKYSTTTTTKHSYGVDNNVFAP